jgi:hypothetical protein
MDSDGRRGQKTTTRGRFERSETTSTRRGREEAHRRRGADMDGRRGQKASARGRGKTQERKFT